MKPLHLNLAARPYRDYKPVYATVVVASLLIAFLALNNIDTYYRYVNETQTTREKIAQVDRQAELERKRTAVAEAQLRGVNMTALDAETRFINARLAERAFSWSELLDRLEDVLPGDVRIVRIGQTFRPDGLVHLDLAFDSKLDNGMLRTLERLRSDPHFANAFPRSEETQEAGGYAFQLSVDFKPSIARIVEK